MINITIEINGFNQLLQAEKHLIEQIITDIEQVFQNTGFERRETRSAIFFYECEEGNTSLSRIVDILFYLHNLIKEKAEEIPGMTVFVQKSGLLEKGLEHNQGISKIFLLPEEDGVWCTREALDLIDHFVSYREANNYYKITDFNRTNLSKAQVPDLFHAGDILDRLLDHVFLMYEEKEVKIPVLSGPSGSGKRLIIQNLLRMIESKNEKKSWLEINSHYDIGPAHISLLHDVTPLFPEQLSRYQSTYEKKVWDELKMLSAIPYRSWSETDALLYFRTYLEVYRSYMNMELFPPIIVVHAFDEMDEQVREFILNILKNNVKSKQFIPILTIRGEGSSSLLSDNLRIETFLMREWIEQLSSKTGMTISSPYQLFIPGTAPDTSQDYPAEDSHILRVLGESVEQVQSVFYCCSVLNGLADKSIIIQIMFQNGIGKDETEQCLYQLVSLGMITDTSNHYPTSKDLYKKMRTAIHNDFSNLEKVIEKVLVLNAQKLELFSLIETANRMHFSEEGVLSIYRLIVQHILSNMEIKLFEQVKKAITLLGDNHPVVNNTVLLLASMCDGDMQSAEEYYRELFTTSPSANEDNSIKRWPQILLTYVEGEYLWRKRGENELVLKKVKQSLLQVQEENFPELESRAIILLGKVMLTNNRMTEASEYFRQARQKTYDTTLNSVACESIALTALSYYLTGDYSLSYSHAVASEQRAHSTGRRLWERYTVMLRARIQFELGRYDEAYQLFQELLTHDRLYFGAQKHNYFMSWLARAAIYQGYIDNGQNILASLPATAETLYFQAEGQLLNRNLESAQSYIETAIRYLEDESDDILPICWLPVDGFEPYENFALKIPGVYNTLRQILYSIEGFCLHEMGHKEESEEAFQNLFAQERISRQDPYRHLYYYFRTITLPSDEDKEELNMLTYLSKAFQSLQKIAGRISDPADRRSFTSQNYWNSKLFDLSRHYKLV